jgi:phosphoribosylaminoimidazole-succinocarboxamide synthase
VAKNQVFFEGQTKQLIESGKNLLMQFDDKVIGSKGTPQDAFKGKGVLCADFSELVFSYLGSYNIPHHMLLRHAKNQLLVRRLDILPFVIHVQNMAVGPLSKRFNLKDGQPLSCPVVEIYHKMKDAPLVMVNPSHCLAFKLATENELRVLTILATKTNAILRSFFERRDLLLVDFQLEIGRAKEGLMVADEISPDTCRLWDRHTGRRMGRDSVLDKGLSAGEAYKDLLERIQ